METHYEAIQTRIHRSFHPKKIYGILLLVALFFAPFISRGQVLIPFGSSWRYAPESSTNLNTTDPTWKNASYAETGWKTGNASFGFGSIHTSGTVLLSRPNPAAAASPSNKNFPIYFFRKNFNIADKSTISSLSLTVKYDDAVVVYLNGKEFKSSNYFPNATIGEGDYFGNPTVGIVPETYQVSISPNDLVNGQNIIAVSLHQGGSQSSDVYFDLQLEASSTPTGNESIAYGSSWRYAPESSTNLNTTDPTWKNASYAETGWKTGNASFGFGSIHTSGTVLLSRPNPAAAASPSNKNFPIYFFRKNFNIADKSTISSLSLTVKYDDAVVVYLNGKEFKSSNYFPNATIGEGDYFGNPTVGTVPETYQVSISPNDLVNGQNVIAVSLHQGGSQSSDAYFDLKLEAVSAGSVSIVRYPYLQLPSYNRMSVWWTTNQPSNSTVRYSMNANMSGFIEVTDAAENTLHKINLTGLQPNTMYYYLVGYGTGNNFIPLQNNTAATNFHTLPDPSDKSATMRFWILGDSGAGEDSIHNPRPYRVRDAYLAYLQQNQNGAKPDAALFIGDNSKKEGFEGEQLALDTSFFKFYNRPYDRQLLSSIPFWTIMGNHDYDSTSIIFNNIKYKIKKAYHKQTAASFSAFAFPDQNQIGGIATNNQKGYYSFDQGDVHFVVLNPYLVEGSVTGVEWDGSNGHLPPVQGETNLNRVLGPSIVFGSDNNIETLPQVMWLRQDLAANTKKWTVVTFHLPPFTTMGHFEDEYDIRNVRNRLLPILEDPKYKVDMVLVSHSHAYLRGGMVRIINGVRKKDNVQSGNDNPYIKTDNETAYSYLLTGSAGRGAIGDGDVLNKLKHPDQSDLPLDNLTGDQDTDFYHAKGGSVELLFKENRLDVTFIRENGASYSVDDHYVIIKNDCNVAAPTLSANPSTINIPPGGSSTLTATGCAGTVTWSQGLGTGTPKVVSPGSTTTYTATCTVNNCTSVNGSVTVRVITDCTPLALDDQCSGNPNEIREYTINLSQGGTFPVDLTYRSHEGPGIVRLRINNGAWKEIAVNQTGLPYVKISIGNHDFIQGNNKVELASGLKYICFRDFCVGSGGTVCNVGVPTLSANPSTINVPPGGSSTLTATGCAGTVTWSHGLGTGSPQVVSPTSTTTYTATCTVGNCTSVNGSVTVTVINVECQPPTLSASPGPGAGCYTLTASGCAGTVTWSHGLGTGNSKVVCPTSTTTYTATCTVGNCTSGNGSVTVGLVPPCTPFALGDQCSGNPNEIRTYNVNLSTGGSFPVDLTYRSHEGPGIVRLRINNGAWKEIPVNQTGLAYEKMSIGNHAFIQGNNKVELASGLRYICFRDFCVGSGGTVCNVGAPTLSANPSTINVPPGGSSTLTATGCAGTVTWSHGLGTGSPQVVSPTSTTTYTATCTVGDCTSGNGSVTVTVINVNCQPPTLSASPGPGAGCYTLTASGCAGTVTWSHSLGTGNSKVVCPTSTTTYTATCTVGNCTSGNGSVTVGLVPPCTPFALGDQCSGNPNEIRTYNINLPAGGTFPVELTYRSHEGNGIVRLRINNGAWKEIPVNDTGLPYVKIPIGNHAFIQGNNKVELASGLRYICFRDFCVGSGGTVCNVGAPTLSANPSTINVPPGGSSTLTATGCAGTVTWSHGLGTGSPQVVSPTSTTTYTATCTVGDCTSGNGSVTVTVVGVVPPTCIVLGDQCTGNSSEIRSYAIDLPSGGSKNVILTYRAHEGNSFGRIRFNGGSWQTFGLVQTPGDLSYMTGTIGSFVFNSGNNTIELASGGGYICFRELCVGNAGARIGVAEKPLIASPELTVSPNPNNGQFEASFYVESGRRAVLSVTDLLGREVWHKDLKGIGIQRETVQLPTQAVGSYILLLRKEATSSSQKAEYKKVIVVK